MKISSKFTMLLFLLMAWSGNSYASSPLENWEITPNDTLARVNMLGFCGGAYINCVNIAGVMGADEVEAYCKSNLSTALTVLTMHLGGYETRDPQGYAEEIRSIPELSVSVQPEKSAGLQKWYNHYSDIAYNLSEYWAKRADFFKLKKPSLESALKKPDVFFETYATPGLNQADECDAKAGGFIVSAYKKINDRLQFQD